MMKRTHRSYAIAFTLGTTLGLNVLTTAAGSGFVAHPAAVGLAAFGSQFFSSGNLSPDVDHSWAPGPPRRRKLPNGKIVSYHWSGHRGWTHRLWFAAVFGLVWGLPGVLFVSRVSESDPGIFASLWIVWAFPIFGWVSHISGDMIYGRLPIFGRVRGLGWETGGLAETGRNRKGAKLWFGLRDPASKVCLIVAAALAFAHVALFAGLATG